MKEQKTRTKNPKTGRDSKEQEMMAKERRWQTVTHQRDKNPNATLIIINPHTSRPIESNTKDDANPLKDSPTQDSQGLKEKRPV
jgi:hypothetical protein